MFEAARMAVILKKRQHAGLLCDLVGSGEFPYDIVKAYRDGQTYRAIAEECIRRGFSALVSKDYPMGREVDERVVRAFGEVIETAFVGNEGRFPGQVFPALINERERIELARVHTQKGVEDYTAEKYGYKPFSSAELIRLSLLLHNPEFSRKRGRGKVDMKKVALDMGTAFRRRELLGKRGSIKISGLVHRHGSVIGKIVNMFDDIEHRIAA